MAKKQTLGERIDQLELDLLFLRAGQEPQKPETKDESDGK